MNNIRSRFCEETTEIVWTLPEHKPTELPIWNCFDEYTIEEMRHFVEIGEAKIGERNTSVRYMLNRALQARGQAPVF